MNIKVRVDGIDDVISEMAHANDATLRGAKRGVSLAAKHLKEKIMSKFGTYQSTGGPPSGTGPWPKLTYESKARKVRKWGHSKPLIGSGRTMNSFKIWRRGLEASVYSNSEVLIHHVYGAPNAGVPQRDPMLVTAKEEERKCHTIIADEIWREMK